MDGCHLALDPMATSGEHAQRQGRKSQMGGATMTAATSDLRDGNLMTIDPVVIGADAQAGEAERCSRPTTSRGFRSSAATRPSA